MLGITTLALTIKSVTLVKKLLGGTLVNPLLLALGLEIILVPMDTKSLEISLDCRNRVGDLSLLISGYSSSMILNAV